MFIVWYISIIFGLSFSFSNGEPIIGINAIPAKDGEFPFIVSLVGKSDNLNVEDDHFCTGVLITKTHVLTAAHCYDDGILNKIQIVLGSVDLRNGTKYDVSFGITYDTWSKKKWIFRKALVNDIAIIKLAKEVDADLAKPAKLSFQILCKLHGENVTVAGWGFSNLDRNRPTRYLQKAPLIVLSDKQCHDALFELTNQLIITQKNVICSRVKPYILIDCGDSGGPLLNKMNEVVGINMGTCPKYKPAHSQEYLNNRVNLHASVYYYQSFIKDVLKKY